MREVVVGQVLPIVELRGGPRGRNAGLFRELGDAIVHTGVKRANQDRAIGVF